jgi:hypothetical protein
MSGNQRDPDTICGAFVLAPTELVRDEVGNGVAGDR